MPSKTPVLGSVWIFIAALAAVVLAVIGWAAYTFYAQNLQGAASAFLPPSQNIADLIDKRELPLTLPKGFSLEVFAKGLGGPRVMAFDSSDTLVVSLPAKGEVVALPDADNNGKADQTLVILKGLNYPHGIAFRCANGACHLYVAETSALAVYDYDPTKHVATNRKVLTNLPSGGEHITRSIQFLPAPQDNILLVAVGSSCNACKESDPRRAAISQINVDGGTLQPYVTGLRNSVFQTINPITKKVWATDNGRDFLGDNLPPDEVNILSPGNDYGWPYCYGQNVHDTMFDKTKADPCVAPAKTPAQIDLHAHSASLGLAFAYGEGWPKDYQGNLFVAYHGSWNSTVPTGYKVVRIKMNPDGTAQSVEDFISGWLKPDGSTLGRPVGLLTMADGELFISDDSAGVIYRVYVTK